MHLIISSKIQQKLKFKNEKLFHLGSMAADSYHYETDNRYPSHFYEMDSKGKRKINPKLFYDKYKFTLDSNFFNGYYFHLISDKIWIDRVFIKYFKSSPYDKNKLQIYYNDFKILNMKLQNIYNLERELAGISKLKEDDIPLMDELQKKSIFKIIESAKGQLVYSEEDNNRNLQLIDIDEICDYIEGVIDIIISKAIVVLNKKYR